MESGKGTSDPVCHLRTLRKALPGFCWPSSYIRLPEAPQSKTCYLLCTRCKEVAVCCRLRPETRRNSSRNATRMDSSRGNRNYSLADPDSPAHPAGLQGTL